MKETKHFVNSTYVFDNIQKDDCVVVSEKHRKEDDNGKISYENKLRFIVNPKRSFYLTKKKLRNHPLKKEFEYTENLDQYTCYNKDLPYKLAKALGEYVNPNRRPNKRKLFNSPYVYGADIEIEPLIKSAYRKKTADIPIDFTYGALDIEKEEGWGLERINLYTFIHEKTIYTGMLDAFMYEGYDENRKRVTEEYVRSIIEEMLEEFFDTFGKSFREGPLKKRQDLFNEKNHIEFKLVTYVAKTEPELIKWVNSKIHKNKTDFVGVWNIGFDIPKILERLEHFDKDPKKYFCHPSVPDRWQKCFFKKDEQKTKKDGSKNKQKEHIADIWHEFICSGYSRYFCAMALYGRLRKGGGREVKYALDYIAKKVLGVGKLTFGRYGKKFGFKDIYTHDKRANLVFRCSAKDLKSGKIIQENGKPLQNSYTVNIPLIEKATGKVVLSKEDIKMGLFDNIGIRIRLPEDSHRVMQRNRFPEYAAYNVMDVILVQLLNWANKDPESVIGLIDSSCWGDFDKQMTLLRNNFYEEYKSKGKIIASVGDKNEGAFDEFLPLKGGTVLDPTKSKNIGLYCVKEYSFLETLAHILVSDIDAGSMYPTFLELGNISRETKLSTVIDIEGLVRDEFEDVFNCMASPIENAVPVCAKTFGLPNYTELDMLFSQELKNEESEKERAA